MVPETGVWGRLLGKPQPPRGATRSCVGKNDRLLIAGPLAGELSADDYSPFDRIGIEAVSAATMEAMIVTGITKSQTKAAEAVAAALKKGGYTVRGVGKLRRLVRPDTVKRWHNRARSGRPKGPDGVAILSFYTMWRGVVIDDARKGRINSQLQILTDLCRRAQGSGQSRPSNAITASPDHRVVGNVSPVCFPALLRRISSVDFRPEDERDGRKYRNRF